MNYVRWFHLSLLLHYLDYKSLKEKQHKKELDNEVACRKKSKDLPYALTCKHAKIDSYTFWEREDSWYLRTERHFLLKTSAYN